MEVSALKIVTLMTYGSIPSQKLISFFFTLIDKWFLISRDKNEIWPNEIAYATANVIYNKNSMYLIGGQR